MRKIILFLLLIAPMIAVAQTTVTGKVVSMADNKPVPYASVFLSNSMVGTRTNDDGSFTLSNVKAGQYDMVISFIGFETHHQTVTVGNTPLNLDKISIKLKNTQLKEVTIGPPDPRRDENIALFVRLFLGHSENAADCKILNKDIVNINYDAVNRTLNVSSDEFLIIENKALGYRIKYLLNKFTKDYKHSFLYYEGSVLFEEMKGKPSQQNKWLKKRLEVYKGSDMHFLRSIFTNQVAEEGFRALRLIRKPNSARPADSLIRARMRYFNTSASLGVKGRTDSADYWQKQYQLPKILEYLNKNPLGINDYAKLTDDKNMLALQYTDYLYVIYTKKAGNSLGDIYHPLDMPSYPTSIITLYSKYAVFDSNGIFIDPTSTAFEGDWANHGVADLLPVDYDPVVK